MLIKIFLQACYRKVETMSIRADYGDLAEILAEAKRLSLDFHEGVTARPAGNVNASFSNIDGMSLNGIGAAGALEVFEKNIMPGLSASVGPRYLGFVTGGATPAAIAGDWLASATDQNMAVPGDSIASYVTQQTLAMLRGLFDLPESFDGSFTSGATASNLLALLTALNWSGAKMGVDVTSDGVARLGKIEIFSACAHASFIKMMGVAGIGRSALVQIDRIPGGEAMDIYALDKALSTSTADVKIVVASAGTVTAASFDDLNAVADICEKHKIFMHVDGAFGLFARCHENYADLCAGIERADSITGDAHKWLNVPYDGAFFFTRHIDRLEASLEVAAPYLDVAAPVPTYMNRSIENSQRFRALPAWMTLMAYGRSGVAQMVAANCAQASRLSGLLVASENFELLTPTSLNVVAFRGIFPHDVERGLSSKLLVEVNKTGDIYLTPGAFDGTSGIRAAFSNWMTSLDDVDIVMRALNQAYQKVAG